MLGSVVVSQDTFRAAIPRPRDQYAFVDAAGGASAETTKALEAAFASEQLAKIRDRDAYADFRAAGFSQVLNLLYVLLALSVVVSLFGIVNTLALAVFERTREVGMLRAVGMTRRQVRRMVRQESIMTSLLGAALGLPVGVALAALAIGSLAKYGVSMSLPVSALVAFVAVAMIVGVLAAILPARRAGKLNVLAALQYE
jgi:putative ABC transport system permease protein